MPNKALFILLLAILPLHSIAQKAYETASYAARLNKKTIRLTLANGYIGASEIAVFNKNKPMRYIPDSGVPDAKNRLTFKPIANQEQEYFILDNMQEAYQELPPYINGKLYVNKHTVAIHFKLVN